MIYYALSGMILITYIHIVTEVRNSLIEMNIKSNNEYTLIVYKCNIPCVLPTHIIQSMLS